MKKKKENCRDFVYFLCTSVFLGSFYAFQIALLVVQLGSVVHWRPAEGLIPATVLRRCTRLHECAIKCISYCALLSNTISTLNEVSLLDPRLIHYVDYCRLHYCRLQYVDYCILSIDCEPHSVRKCTLFSL